MWYFSQVQSSPVWYLSSLLTGYRSRYPILNNLWKLILNLNTYTQSKNNIWPTQQQSKSCQLTKLGSKQLRHLLYLICGYLLTSCLHSFYCKQVPSLSCSRLKVVCCPSLIFRIYTSLWLHFCFGKIAPNRHANWFQIMKSSKLFVLLKI